MKKIKTDTIDLTGVTINDIMEFPMEELTKMNKNDLVAISNRLNSASNKRLNRIKNTSSPSVTSRFSSKGKDRDSVLKEIHRAREFLNNATSTLKGWKKVKKATKKRFEEESGYTLNERQQTKFWDVFKKLKEYGNIEEDTEQSDKLKSMLQKYYGKVDKRKSVDHILEDAEKELITKQYEENQEENTQVWEDTNDEEEEDYIEF